MGEKSDKSLVRRRGACVVNRSRYHGGGQDHAVSILADDGVERDSPRSQFAQRILQPLARPDLLHPFAGFSGLSQFLGEPFQVA